MQKEDSKEGKNALCNLSRADLPRRSYFFPHALIQGNMSFLKRKKRTDDFPLSEKQAFFTDVISA